MEGRTDIKYLRDNGCKIWDGDYVKSGRTNGELGPIYGKQWRGWTTDYGETSIDQITNLINEIKINPDSRRLMVNAWNVGDLDKMVLPPCHYGFQCYVSNDNKLSLLWNQRSVDVFIGLPFNISSYGMLLMILCKETGYEPGQLIGNFGDVHIYKNHLPQVKEIVKRIGYELPKLEIIGSDILQGEFEFKITNYQSHESLKAKLSN